jgi:hypothetical protein
MALTNDPIAGRATLVITLADTPEPGMRNNLIILVDQYKATVNIDGCRPVVVDAYLLTREQAIELAAKLAEIIGTIGT